MQNSEVVESILNYHKDFNYEDSEKWLERMEKIEAREFLVANQVFFEKGGNHSQEKSRRRDLFLKIIKEKIHSKIPNFPKGHPVDNCLRENRVLKELVSKISKNILKKSLKKREIIELFNKTNLHYLKKEEALFPYLEKRGFTYPSVWMWEFHDEIRESIKTLKSRFKEELGRQYINEVRRILKNVNEMTIREEKMLLPAAVAILSSEDWSMVRESEALVGYILEIEPPFWQLKIKKSKRSLKKEILSIKVGEFTVSQLNLIFSHLPIDITMVDEHGKVVFFNQSKDRIFSRTPSIIGREVKLCHPPKSLDKVLKILDAFKNGTKNEAQFWIKLEDKTIHIRYFALKDENGKYKGVLETTQDISKMGELKGEKRLLDWQEGSIA